MLNDEMEEFKRRISSRFDPDELVDFLCLTTDDLVEAHLDLLLRKLDEEDGDEWSNEIGYD